MSADSIKTVAVLGAGTMGGGIAALCLGGGNAVGLAIERF
jgi:3-hydroxyacyl-CoA dehydrogenase